MSGSISGSSGDACSIDVDLLFDYSLVVFRAERLERKREMRSAALCKMLLCEELRRRPNERHLDGYADDATPWRTPCRCKRIACSDIDVSQWKMRLRLHLN